MSQSDTITPGRSGVLCVESVFSHRELTDSQITWLLDMPRGLDLRGGTVNITSSFIPPAGPSLPMTKSDAGYWRNLNENRCELYKHAGEEAILSFYAAVHFIASRDYRGFSISLSLSLCFSPLYSPLSSNLSPLNIRSNVLLPTLHDPWVTLYPVFPLIYALPNRQVGRKIYLLRKKCISHVPRVYILTLHKSSECRLLWCYAVWFL
jgi:hypothetical protein